jgi:hypothetical protein
MNVDPHKINLSENDLESYLFENPRLVELPYSQEPIKEWFGRQLQVPSGIIDLAGITESNNIAVVELKNSEFKSSHITQVCRYASDIEQAMNIAGLIEEPFVYKLLIGTYEPDTQIIKEADSVNVSIFTISVEYDLKIGGRWHFSDKYENECREKLSKIAQMDPFVKLAVISQAKFAAEAEDKKNG